MARQFPIWADEIALNLRGDNITRDSLAKSGDVEIITPFEETWTYGWTPIC